MAGIQDYLNLIKNAIYGKDVRQAIHDGIQQCYYDGKAGSTDLEARQRLDSAEGSINSLDTRMSTAEGDIVDLDARVDQIVAPSGGAPSAAEVADGRVVDGVTYNLIGDAIRGVNTNLKAEASKNLEALRGTPNTDIAPLLNWSQGSVNSSGIPISSSIRILSDFVDLMPFSELFVSCESGYKFAFELYTQSGTFIGDWAFQASPLRFTTINAQNARDYKCRILFGKTDNSAIVPSDASNIHIVAINEVSNDVEAESYNVKSISKAFEDAIGVLPIDYSKFMIGTMSVSGGVVSVSRNNWQRVVTAVPIKLKQNTVISLTDFTNYQFSVAYSEDGGTYVGTGWLNAQYYCPVDGWYYILISKIGTESNITNIYDFVSKLSLYRGTFYNDSKPSDEIVKELEQGSLTSTGVNNDGATLTIRRRTNIAFAHKGSVLCVPNDFAEFYFDVHLLGDTITTSGWSREYYFENDSFFRLIVRKTDNSAWTSADEERYASTVRFVDAPKNYYWLKSKENINSVCHAGFEDAPENTIPAFVEAYNAGFTIMECDSRITKDGVFVLLHDATINRTGRNADGSVISETINVADLTYAELQEYDFGIWKGDKYAGTKIPKTEDALKMFKALDLGVYIDIGTYPYFSKEQIWELMDIVDSCGMHDNVYYLVQSGYASYILEKDPTANIGFVANAAWWISAAVCQTGKNAVFLDAQFNTITQEKINNAKNHNIPTEAWTVTDAESQAIVDGFDYITGVTGTINPAQMYYKEKTGVTSLKKPIAILNRANDIDGGYTVKDGICHVECSFVSNHQSDDSPNMLSGFPMPRYEWASLSCMEVDTETDTVRNIGAVITQANGVVIMPEITNGMLYLLDGRYYV